MDNEHNQEYDSEFGTSNNESARVALPVALITSAFGAIRFLVQMPPALCILPLEKKKPFYITLLVFSSIVALISLYGIQHFRLRAQAISIASILMVIVSIYRLEVLKRRKPEEEEEHQIVNIDNEKITSCVTEIYETLDKELVSLLGDEFTKIQDASKSDLDNLID